MADATAADARPASPSQAPDLQAIVAATSTDYAPYLIVEDNEHYKEDKAVLAEDVNTLLARMDEFHGLVSTIEVDTQQVVDNAIPELTTQCTKLTAIFDKIANLEKFVGIVKTHVTEMDEHVTAAELEYTAAPLRAVKSVLAGKGLPQLTTFISDIKRGTGAASPPPAVVAVGAGEDGTSPPRVGSPELEPEPAWVRPPPFEVAKYFPEVSDPSPHDPNAKSLEM